MNDSADIAEVTGLRDALARLGALDPAALDDAARIEVLAGLERLKGAAAAAQARVAVAFEDSQRDAEDARGVRPEARGRGVAAQVALAMRTSPARARRFLGVAHALTELPRTYDALASGETSEYRAFLVARETAHLSREHRGQVDAELAARPGGIGALGDRSAEGAARSIAQRLDPAGACRRHKAAVRQRRVSLRPAPDGMSRLSAVLPVVDGVSAYAALHQAAETARAEGDERSRGAVMADELVARVTGRSAREPDVEVHLVMTDGALLGDSHEPAQVVSATGSHGTVPADVARGLVREAARAWVRRLHTDPGTGDLVAMDSRRRTFTGMLRRFLVIRDQTCRTPWCDAPVRHLDHVRSYAEGGPTSARNAQGLCEACNQAKNSGALIQRAGTDGTVHTTTSTGRAYRSPPPRLLTEPPPRPDAQVRVEWSSVERDLLDLVLGA